MGYPGIYTIRGVMGVCHLLVGDDGAVLLDTGLVGEPWLIRWRLAHLGLKPHDVKAILLTHGHIDHAAAQSTPDGAAALRRAGRRAAPATLRPADREARSSTLSARRRSRRSAGARAFEAELALAPDDE